MNNEGHIPYYQRIKLQIRKEGKARMNQMLLDWNYPDFDFSILFLSKKKLGSLEK